MVGNWHSQLNKVDYLEQLERLMKVENNFDVLENYKHGTLLWFACKHIHLITHLNTRQQPICTIE